ncbi:MAG: TrkA family potassium uptake protein [bacterium]
MKTTKQYAILGLGRFGQKMAKELSIRDQEVIVIDRDENKVQPLKDMVSHAYIGDISDEAVLKEAGVASCDVVIIAESSNIEANILATQICKGLDIPKVVVKSQSTLHGKILRQIQADVIVYPEQDTAIKLADKLTHEGMLDYIEVSKECNVIEYMPPKNFVGKTLKDLEFRQKYKVAVLAIKRGDETVVSPGGDEKVEAGDIMILSGQISDLETFGKMGD